jgi:hypothetical protein
MVLVAQLTSLEDELRTTKASLASAQDSHLGQLRQLDDAWNHQLGHLEVKAQTLQQEKEQLLQLLQNNQQQYQPWRHQVRRMTGCASCCGSSCL